VLSTNAGGVLSTLAYDKRGNKVAMADPVMGSWAYDYNVFGELVSQTDSLNRITTYVYDKLGRNTKRTEPDLVSEWSFDKMFDGSACGKSLGVLCEAKSDNGYRRVNTYDSLSRLVSTGNSLDNSPTLATVSASYSSDSGRVAFRTWPTGLQAAYSYTSRGYPQHVQVGGNAGFPETMTMTIDGMDANGNVTSYRQGGQLIKTDKQFNDVTGVLALQTVTANGGTVGNVLKQAYTYDKLDNLYLRKDDSPGVGISESFSYDSLNRVREYLIVGNGVSPPRTTGILYDARGNITYKSDVGQYVYDASRPNRLKSIALTTPAGAPTNTGTRAFTFAFDDAGGKLVNGVATGDGNVVETLIQDSATGLQTYRRQVYTSYKMPSSIALGGYAAGVAGPAQRTVSFAYGPEHQRIKEQSDIAAGAPGQSAAGTTWFLNGEDGVDLTYEKEVFASGLVEHRHYLNLAGLVFGIRTTRAGVLNGAPATSGRYLHHDHLGSLVAVTDEGGTVVERLAYDPWGKRRLPDGNADPLGQLIGQQTSRGFTMHEHLDRLGAINMNGRIYDPTIGRFLSADPFIQSPSNLQSYNRYSYVLNNPLAYTDPSGHFSLKKLVRGIVAVVASFYTGQWAGGWSVWGGSQTLAGSIATGVAGGFTGGVINSGTLKGGLYGALSGGAFGAVGYGTEGWSDLSKVAAHAAVGCATQSIAGGSCKAGALSAGFSKWATVTSGEGGEAADFNDVVAIGIKSSLIGGVASVLGGGKFEDGVLTAAYGYIFNQIAHNLTNAEKKAWGESYAESKLALTSDQIIRNAKGYAIVNGQRVGIEIDRIIIDSTGNYIKAVEVKWGESASYTGNQRVTSVQVARGDIYITNQNLINPNKTLANQSQSYEHRIFTINATRVIRSSVTATRLKNGARLTSTWFAPFASGIQ
jgi:RHS repeat-associated protein